MMFELTSEGRQLTFVNPGYPFYQFSDRVHQRILNSFEGFFRAKILPLIPAEYVDLLYSPKENVRPGNGVTVVAAILYMRVAGIKESYFLSHIHTDIAIQYAIGTEDRMIQPFSERTFRRFRRRLLDAEESLSIDVWDKITSTIDESIAQNMGLNTMFSATYSAAYRIDSLMIHGHATHMTRLQLVYTAVKMAVILMVQVDAIEYLPKQLSHFLDKKDDHKFTYYKGTKKEVKAEYDQLHTEMPAEILQGDDSGQARKKRLALISELRLNRLGEEIILAKNMLESIGLDYTEQYQLIVQLIKEQMELTPNGNYVFKDGKQITGGSLQSLYDTFMTYRRKNDEKNYGYIGCCAEKYNPSGTGCIVWRQFEPNIYSDQKFADKFYDYLIEKYQLTTSNFNRIAVSCDALFTSAELQNKVRNDRIDIYCASTGFTPDPILVDFKFNDDRSQIIECPANHTPSTSKFNPDKSGGTIKITFKDGECAHCAYCSNCKATTGKRGTSTVEVRLNQVLAAENIKKLSDPTFHMFVDKRNGVESIPAALRKGYAIDDCQQFGYLSHRRYFYTGVTALNIKKYYLYFIKTYKTEK